ncbi:hypothetical protein NFI96_000188 [Prochilodus magdalenae]|nr:hypothetical protein NFI96_000188 [Prochilodus magdalenae]
MCKPKTTATRKNSFKEEEETSRGTKGNPSSSGGPLRAADTQGPKFVNVNMAQRSGAGDASEGTGAVAKRCPSSGLRSRPRSGERDGQVRAVKALLMEKLGPYERLVTYMQAVLVWERPFHSVLFHVLFNVVFWTPTGPPQSSVTAGLRIIHRPKRTSQQRPVGSVLWAASCGHQHRTAELSSLTVHLQGGPARFFALTSLRLLFLLASGLALAVCVDTWRSKIWPKIKVVLRRRPIIKARGSGDASDSEEELAAFCPTFDEAVVAKELALTDSEHSDAEVSYTENGTFNLSRGQTPLTEGSEDLETGTVTQESFAQDLPDFPSITPGRHPDGGRRRP